MSLKIVHISDTHGAKYHSKLVIPECDVLIHTGDIGGRTNTTELAEFLIWFEQQPARKKIWCAGNHDIILDKDHIRAMDNPILRLLMEQQHRDALEMMNAYDIKYLNGKDYIFEGVKFFGSPFSPSFHRQYWAFNADRGAEIRKEWSKIPNDVNVLMTHSPVKNILDECDNNTGPGRENVGCEDLLAIIKKRLHKLQLHCSGHIHDQYGVVLKPVSNTRRVLFSNGAVVTNEGIQNVIHPLIITI